MVGRELGWGAQQQGKHPDQGKGMGSRSPVSATQSQAALWVIKATPGACHTPYLHGLQLRFENHII